MEQFKVGFRDDNGVYHTKIVPGETVFTAIDAILSQYCPKTVIGLVKSVPPPKITMVVDNSKKHQWY